VLVWDYRYLVDDTIRYVKYSLFESDLRYTAYAVKALKNAFCNA
jgi:hypothetical protein